MFTVSISVENTLIVSYVVEVVSTVSLIIIFSPASFHHQLEAYMSQLTQAPKNERKVQFQSIVLSIIGHLVRLPQNPGSQPSEDTQDGVFNYACKLLTYCLLHREFNDAIREGDGLRVIRC